MPVRSLTSAALSKQPVRAAQDQGHDCEGADRLDAFLHSFSPILLNLIGEIDVLKS